MLRPATTGTGLKAWSSVRTVLELAGFANILSKIIGSNNSLNNAIATIEALLAYKVNPDTIQAVKELVVEKVEDRKPRWDREKRHDKRQDAPSHSSRPSQSVAPVQAEVPVLEVATDDVVSTGAKATINLEQATPKKTAAPKAEAKTPATKAPAKATPKKTAAPKAEAKTPAKTATKKAK